MEERQVEVRRTARRDLATFSSITCLACGSQQRQRERGRERERQRGRERQRDRESGDRFGERRQREEDGSKEGRQRERERERGRERERERESAPYVWVGTHDHIGADCQVSAGPPAVFQLSSYRSQLVLAA